MNVTNISFSFTLTCQIHFQDQCHFNRLEWAQRLSTKVFVCYFWCSWGSIWVSGVLVGVWGVLPWLFLSLHCTGCESWGSYLTSHKNSGQLTVGLERERETNWSIWRMAVKSDWRTRPSRRPTATSDPNWTNEIEQICVNLKHGALHDELLSDTVIFHFITIFLLVLDSQLLAHMTINLSYYLDTAACSKTC